MKKGMNTSEMLVKVTNECRTREILAILESCKDLQEAKEKVKALLGEN